MNTHTELGVTPLLTNSSEFHTAGTRSFFSVSAGIPVADALHEASRALLRYWFVWLKESASAEQWADQFALLEKQSASIRRRQQQEGPGRR